MVSPIMIGLLLIIANNKKIMGTYINGWVTNLLTVIAFIVMAIGAVAIFVIH
jgi:Mn2+/Fe2+ NRAMP family transporter